MTAPAPFSIVPLEGDHDSLPLPENGPYFVATQKGYFVHRNFHFGRTLSEIKELPATPPMVPTLWANVDPKLPAALLGQAYSFFRAIYQTKQSEAMVDLIWSPERGYRLFVPPQQATGSGVKAVRTPEHVHGQLVGTIHSHCDFSAFHSGTDKHDAGGHDGLHITIGDVMKTPSIAAMISVSGVNYDMNLDEYCDGPLVAHPHPTWWERYVEKPSGKGLYSAAHDGIWSEYRTTQTTTWKPKGAPNPNTPTVIGTSHLTDRKVMGIEELMWRYDSLFNEEEAAELDEAAGFLDVVDTMLARLGIELTYDLNLLNVPITAAGWLDQDDFLDRSSAP